MKAACIIVNTTLKKLDRVFHYLVPEGMDLQPGHRVLVPFGAGNRKTEGYCLGFEEIEPNTTLKYVAKRLDEQPLLSPSRIALARFIKRRYICSMSEALHLLLPPAMHFQTEERVSVIPTKSVPKLTPKQQAVWDYLCAVGEPISLTKIKRECGLANRSVVDALRRNGLVQITEHAVQQQQKQYRKTVYLTCDIQTATETAELLERKAPSAANALRILMHQPVILLSELLQEAKCSAQSVEVLCRYRCADIVKEERYRRPTPSVMPKKSEKHMPTPEQAAAIARLTKSLSDGFEEFLLYGVTGSGKTEVFLQAVETCVAQGKNAVVLVPEIALTPQMTNRFLSRFQNNVAVLHSGLSLGERYDEWRRIRNGEVSVVIGARSAVFAPFDDIGLLIMDEEHETSYKSESNPRYHAREIAKYRAMQYGATVVYASATPGVESFYKAQCGEYQLLQMTQRYNKQQLPAVHIVDLAQELQSGNHSVISRVLQREIEKNLTVGQQTILLMNRRGHSTFVSCRDCGYAVKCPHCSITLTYHLKTDSLVCHYCGYTQNNITVCPECGSKHVKHFGTGTQKVEQQLRELFPTARIGRMDGDTTGRKSAHEKILNAVEQKQIDILLGTQMVAKGLDFSNVTLVGVIAADTMLNLSDFRASERAFSLLTQVCGRAGRGSVAGRAVIQTYMPNDKTLGFAAHHNYPSFYQNEIRLRRFLCYPPFSEMVYITVSGEDAEATKHYIAELFGKLKSELKNSGHDSEMLGPGPAGIFRVKNRYRYGILIKTKYVKTIIPQLEKMYYYHLSKQNEFTLGIDTNPNQIF